MTDNILIVIDMQNDFVTGSLGSDAAKSIIPAIKSEIKKYEDNNSLVILTRDTHNENYLDTPEGKKLPVQHCIRNTDGWQIVPEITSGLRNNSHIIINKPSFGYADWATVTDFNNKNIKLCGVCTDICVVSNALILKALFPTANISVDAKLCAGTSEAAHNAALMTMKSCQIDIIE